MKSRTSALLLGGLLLSGLSSPAATSPYRNDINPALLYWQAFAVMPELKEPTQRELNDQYSTAPVDEQYEALANRFDAAFKLVNRAAQLKQPCDWGIDMANGPETLLPHLAKVRAVVHAARLRARCFLAHGKENEAIQDLLSAFVLGRQTGSDGVLISTLVQYACENLIVTFVAENFNAFSPPGLQKLMAGIDASPARGTVSQSIGRGERACIAWYGRRIREIQAKHPGDEAQVMSQVRELLAATLDVKKDYTKADAFIQEAGDTSADLLTWLERTEASYDELEKVAALPYDRFGPAEKAIREKVEKSANPFSRMLFPAFDKARSREFGTMAAVEMLRAAVQYRVRGEPGLQSVRDPFGSGPFEFHRFLFENVDRGFELKSKFAGQYPAVLILVEKSGPPFQVAGQSAGQSPAKP
jgi:ribosomal protein S24E